MAKAYATPTDTDSSPRGFGPATLGFYTLLVLAGLLGLALLGYLFFIGVGYLALPLLLALTFLAYLAMAVGASYALTRLFNSPCPNTATSTSSHANFAKLRSPSSISSKTGGWLRPRCQGNARFAAASAAASTPPC